MNIVSIGLLMWHTAMWRCTAWCLEAGYVSLCSGSRGQQQRAYGMSRVDNREPNCMGAFARDPSAVEPQLEVADPSVTAIIVATTDSGARTRRAECATQSSSGASTAISPMQWHACRRDSPRPSSRHSSHRDARRRERARSMVRR
jgi:hypothetical protein